GPAQRFAFAGIRRDAHLPGLDGPTQRLRHAVLLENRQLAGMQVNDVQAIGPQPRESRVDALRDATGRPVRDPRNAVADFGGEDDARAPARQTAPEPLL